MACEFARAAVRSKDAQKQYYWCERPESAYDMKNIFCLFERPFKIQKNGVFLFEISFFVLEILTFF